MASRLGEAQFGTSVRPPHDRGRRPAHPNLLERRSLALRLVSGGSECRVAAGWVEGVGPDRGQRPLPRSDDADRRRRHLRELELAAVAKGACHGVGRDDDDRVVTAARSAFVRERIPPST
jgi:hypothetical protein